MSHQEPSNEHRLDAIHGSGNERMAVLREPGKTGMIHRDERTQAEEALRVAAALRDGHRLAFPVPPPVPSHTMTDDESRRAENAAEEDVLRGMRRVLTDLTLAPVDVFVDSRDAGWRTLPEVDAAAGPSLGRVDWPEFPAGEALLASPSRLPHLWAALGAWREQNVLDSRAAAVIPVLIGDELRGVAAVSVVNETRDDAMWLSAAVAVAGFAAAGIHALRLEQRARGEAHARDAYISLAAHELRSPLTSIKGYAQLLLRQARKNPIPESMQRSIESIEQQSMRMAEMVGEMLDASRIRRGKLDVICTSTDLIPLMRKVVERRASFYPQHQINIEAPEEPLVGNFDNGRIEQVLRDLIDNAARHSPSGGVIEVQALREGDEVVVSLRDRGIGIPTADRERIFEYLYRSPVSEQRNLSGLGLGLFVSRHLIERMGGHLALHASSTEEPTGSEFRMTLPLA